MRPRAAARTAVALAAAALIAAGCGDTSRVREPDLVVSGTTPAPRDSARAAQREDDRTRIAVVTHGEA